MSWWSARATTVSSRRPSGAGGPGVVVVEAPKPIGGAAKTEQPFTKVPGLSQSTGAYLLGLMPPELPRKLGVDLPLLRRDPHYFLPTTGDRYLLFGADRDADSAAVSTSSFRRRTGPPTKRCRPSSTCCAPTLRPRGWPSR